MQKVKNIFLWHDKHCAHIIFLWTLIWFLRDLLFTKFRFASLKRNGVFWKNLQFGYSRKYSIGPNKNSMAKTDGLGGAVNRPCRMYRREPVKDHSLHFYPKLFPWYFDVVCSFNFERFILFLTSFMVSNVVYFCFNFSQGKLAGRLRNRKTYF